MKTIIVDDERPARLELRRLLAAFPDVAVAGEADSAEAARDLIGRERPDLVFLDIEMPEASGFDLLDSLEPPCPQVVFTTAYNAYAVRAFEVNALDYLLKPIHPRRLAASVAKVQKLLAEPGRDAAGGDGRSTVPGGLRPDENVFVRDGDRCWFVPVRALMILESEGNHTRIRFPDASPLLYRTLASMEERLPPELFIRANRSQLINMTMIEAIEPWFSGSLKVRLRGGTEVEFSAGRRRRFANVAVSDDRPREGQAPST